MRYINLSQWNRVVVMTACMVLLVGCDWGSAPKSYDEAMKRANQAFMVGDMENSFKLCQSAFEMADKVGNGSRTIAALDCLADTSKRLGKPEKAFPAYATVIGTYDNDLKVFSSRLRLRNNYGVALYNAGRRQEGIQTLEDALDAYQGTPYASTFYAAFSHRMRMVVNLAHATRDQPNSAIADRLAGEITEEIKAKIESSVNGVNLAMNAAEGLAAVAELIRVRGDSTQADELAALAAERQKAEDSLAAVNPGWRRECEEMPALGANAERCFDKLP